MLRHLLCGQGRFADSASKTHTPPANSRRTPLCHPDHHLKRKERRQAVGLVCAPLKRMGMGLGAADIPCREATRLKIRDSSIIAPVNLFRCPQRRSVIMRR